MLDKLLDSAEREGDATTASDEDRGRVAIEHRKARSTCEESDNWDGTILQSKP